MKVALRYIHEYRDRHGKVRRYFRRPGQPKIALRGEPGSPAFLADYQAAQSGHRIERPIGADRSAPGTVAATVAAYYQDAAFLGLATGTRKMRRQILERLRAEHGDKRLAVMEQRHVAQMLGKLRPVAARNWLKALRGLMLFAVSTGLRAEDPTAGFKPVRYKPGTIHTWTEDEIAVFEAAHPIGSRARLAMALLLFTAARLGDAVGLGHQYIRAGRLSYRQQKTGRALTIPLHPDFVAILAATPSEHLTFLVTPQGKPYTAPGFGHAMRKWCNEVGLPQCSSHGLRKAQARRLAEAGCSTHEIASITGHKTLAEVQRYADAADQVRLADAAIARTSTGSPNSRVSQFNPKPIVR